MEVFVCFCFVTNDSHMKTIVMWKLHNPKFNCFDWSTDVTVRWAALGAFIHALLSCAYLCVRYMKLHHFSAATAIHFGAFTSVSSLSCAGSTWYC